MGIENRFRRKKMGIEGVEGIELYTSGTGYHGKAGTTQIRIRTMDPYILGNGIVAALCRRFQEFVVRKVIETATDPIAQEKARNEALAFLEQIKSFSVPAYEKTRGFFEEAFDQAQMIAAQTKLKAEAGLERARPRVIDAVDKTKLAAGAAWESTRSAAEKMGEKVKEHPKTTAAVVCAVAAPAVTVAAVTAAGFTTAGVAAGSIAATAQSVVYGGATTGVFSVLQSVGATGALSIAGTAAASTTGAVVGAGVGAAMERA